MFPGLKGRPDRNDFADITRAHADVEMAAHGASVVEIALVDGKWRPVTGSRLNRRFTATTEMTVDGPAAGHDRLETKADPTGRKILGTFNNCAGGQTPWGTYLTAEENFHGYFWTDQKGVDGRRLTRGLGGTQRESYRRYGVPGNWYSWGRYHDRFNVDREPNEPNRFGWIVEIDPTDPASTPVKHTALGRLRHEGAESIVNKDGRVVVYSGDDAQFDYVYRFVSRDRVRPGDKAHNMRLLSEGTLSVARFNDDGTATWLPLVFGQGPLTPANGFNSQADVLIDARLAADRLEATPMDRPEDVQPHPTSGKVFVLLTNNAVRKPEQVNKANPRPENYFGHVIEMTAPGADHAAETYRWDILIKCGDPRVAAVGALWHPATSADGWFGSPDNCAIDADGRLWIATDQGSALVAHAARRRPLRHRDGRRAARPLQAVLPRAGRRGAVRALLHARRHHGVSRGAASCHRRRAQLEAVRQGFDLREPRHPLARLQARHAAAALRGGGPQAGRGQDRGLNAALPPGLGDPGAGAIAARQVAIPAWLGDKTWGRAARSAQLSQTGPASDGTRPG